MYGDCQVESLFGSPIRNPNLNFMSSTLPTSSYHLPSFSSSLAIIPKEEANMIQGGHPREEDIESGSMGQLEAAADEDLQDPDQHQPKKKRYHRHTAHQIQEMENLFKECPHPDEKQRMKLSQELGLKPRQVKFWFQNRRTQMKAQQDRAENMILKAENDNLKNENYRLQAALRSITCANCGGPGILGDMSVDDQHLRIENARLKDELERFASLIPPNGRPINTLGLAPPLLLPSVDLGMNVYPRHFQEPMGTCTSMIPLPSLHDATNLSDSNLIMEQDRPLALEFAMNAMEELIKMSRLSEPLWVQNGTGAKEVLNMEEYSNAFPWQRNFKQQPGFRTEATRDTSVVIMNSITLVDAFLDAHKWMELFPSIVARARTLQTISSGISGHAHGSLQLMYAEMQALSPLIPTREARFLRYCQQNAEEGTWAVVDFPIDSLNISHQYSLPRYSRRPSGCIIQDMPNGYSRVTWVEHAEIEDKPIHQIFNELVSSGTAFGAPRWLAVLQQQCERLASLMARNISDLGVIPSPEARRNLMKLTQRMIRTFCYNISTSAGQSWTAISDSAEDTIRITTRKNTEPGQPNGVILCAVSTTWLPFTHQEVFDLLRDERRRSQLDVLASGTSSHEVAHIANGSHPGNCISLLRINASSNSSQNVELMLQESSTDKSASLVVYSSVDVDAVQLAMNGEDPSYIPLLPLGFVVTPMRPWNNKTSLSNSGSSITSSDDGNGNAPSCLLTVGVQVLASTIPTGKINLSNVTAVNTHICNVVHQINAALGVGGGGETTPSGPSHK